MRCCESHEQVLQRVVGKQYWYLGNFSLKHRASNLDIHSMPLPKPLGWCFWMLLRVNDPNRNEASYYYHLWSYCGSPPLCVFFLCFPLLKHAGSCFTKHHRLPIQCPSCPCSTSPSSFSSDSVHHSCKSFLRKGNIAKQTRNNIQCQNQFDPICMNSYLNKCTAQFRKKGSNTSVLQKCPSVSFKQFVALCDGPLSWNMQWTVHCP